MLRRLGLDAIDESLWAEDAHVFTNQAFGDGMGSLWTPYQGFLHTFQRLATLGVLVAPLSMLPWVLFLGWCLAFAWMASELVGGLTALGVKVGSISLALVAVVLQPHGGEVFFSITNAQWLVGLALCLHVAIPRPDSRNPLVLVMIAIAGVTGPFSLLLLPIMGLQLIIERDWHARWRTYALVAIGACVELPVLLLSPRLRDPSPYANDLDHWLTAAWKFATFGAQSAAMTVAAASFWGVVAATMAWMCVTKRLDRERRLAVLYLVLSALWLFAVSLYSASLWMDIATMTPVGNGGRYYFVPYALLFVAATLILKDLPTNAGAAYALLAVVCIGSVHSLARDNLQWRAFARFATLHAGVAIPVNPQVAPPPSFVVTPPARAVTGSAPAHSIAVDPTAARVSHSFSAAKHCAGHPTVAVEAQVRRELPGIVYLRWGSGAAPAHTLMRFYPAGLQTMQFAVRRQPGENDFELAAYPGGAPLAVEQLTLYCL